MNEQFRQCCDEFFMNVVYSLCFLGGIPPQPDAIKKLLGLCDIGN